MNRQCDDLPSTQAQDRFGNTFLARVYDIFMSQPSAPRMFVLQGRGAVATHSPDSPQQHRKPVMTTSTNTIFQAFIEAQQALEKLPAAEAELAKAKAELETTHRAWDESELKAMSLEDELNALKATLAAREADLAQATFREQEVANKLAVIQSVIGLPKQPEPVVVAASVTAEGQAPQSSGEAATEEGSHMGEGDTSGDTRASEVGSEFHTDPAPDQRDADPTASGTENPFHGATIGGATKPDNADSTHSPTRLPYWRRPADQSWADWVSEGNEPAPWLDREYRSELDVTTGA